MDNTPSMNDTDKPLKDRRNFLQKSALLSLGTCMGSSLLASNYKDNSVIQKRYGEPSPYEHNVIRRNSKKLSSGDWDSSFALSPIQDINGIITPNGLFFNRIHSGTIHINPNKYKLMIHGLVKKPIVLTLKELKRYPRTSRIHFIECASNGLSQENSLQSLKGMMGCAEWTGVYIKDILKDLGLKPQAKWMLAQSSDNTQMSKTIPIDKILDDAMLVYAQNGEALRPEQGYPVRLLLPGWKGSYSIKWIKRLEFSKEPFFSKDDTSQCNPMQHKESSPYIYPIAVNSIITNPSPEYPWSDVKDQEWVEIEGLAWSGQGTIKGVDISLDGGKNWQKAHLKGLVLPKAWTRFSFMYKFTKGKKLLLASRAYDDAGFIQPTTHKSTNKIHTWEITSHGKVNNVNIL